MRILLAHNHYKSSAPSGEDIIFCQERNLLSASGFDVFAYERYNDEIDEDSKRDLISVAVSAAWSRSTYRAISELIKRAAPDIAHFHNTFPLISPSAYAACRHHGVPVIQTLHNYRLICPGALLLRNGRSCEECVGRNLLPALHHRCYRDSFVATSSVVWMLARNRLMNVYRSHVDKYTALTRFAAERMIAGGFPAERICVMPNFLPNLPVSRQKSAHRYAVYVGRLRKEKGVATLLQAWRSLPDLPLFVLGNGEQRGELQRFAAEQGLNVQFLGMCDRGRVLQMVTGAAVQIVPSEWYEGFPLVILEAYACGTAVVASDIGSLSELVENGKTGLLFKAGDPTDLAEKVHELISGTRAEQLGDYAFRAFEEKYTAAAHLVQITALYENVIAGSKARLGLL